MTRRQVDPLAKYRRKVRKSRPMPEHVKRELAERRRQKRLEEDRRRAENVRQSSQAGAWRANRLRRYVHQVLQLRGRRRLEYFEAHPISDIFK